MLMSFLFVGRLWHWIPVAGRQFLSLLSQSVVSWVGATPHTFFATHPCPQAAAGGTGIIPVDLEEDNSMEARLPLAAVPVHNTRSPSFSATTLFVGRHVSDIWGGSRGGL